MLCAYTLFTAEARGGLRVLLPPCASFCFPGIQRSRRRRPSSSPAAPGEPHTGDDVGAAAAPGARHPPSQLREHTCYSTFTLQTPHKTSLWPGLLWNHSGCSSSCWGEKSCCVRPKPIGPVCLLPARGPPVTAQTGSQNSCTSNSIHVWSLPWGSNSVWTPRSFST